MEHNGEEGPWFKGHPEFVPGWDVARYDDGSPITLTPEQGHAVLRALTVLRMVEEAEGGSCGGVWLKSRLLGRMLYQGLPPTKTKPPRNWGAPDWALLPDGDPFLTDDEKREQEAAADEFARQTIEALNRPHIGRKETS